jgi:hypothetical protein
MKDDEARGEIPARGAGGQRSGLRRSTEGLTGGMKPGWVYLMANHRRGQTYLGVTSDLPRRAWKVRLIEERNPNWDDLYDTLF